MEKLWQLQTALQEKGFPHGEPKLVDYIAHPQPSVYRSLHLIYKYHDPAWPECHGMLIELQMRTRLQHAWATAVETVDTFQKLSLKFSQGPEEWLEFFALTTYRNYSKANVDQATADYLA